MRLAGERAAYRPAQLPVSTLLQLPAFDLHVLALERFLEELHRNRGVDFRSYKRPTILRRLGRRMAATNCESLDEYSRYVDEHPEEYRQLRGCADRRVANVSMGDEEPTY